LQRSTLHNSEPAGPRRLHLLYHELRPSGSAYSYVIDTAAFERHLDLYLELRQSDKALWPEITFDDGDISNYEFALPRLHSRGLTAHFFITAGWTGTKAGYMGWNELRTLYEAGQIIGAHGWSHTLLTHCDQKQLDHELRTTRLTLEEKLGTAITTMSLPGGRYNSGVLAACKEAGYTRVFTSAPRAEDLPLGETVGRLNIRGDMTQEWIANLFVADSKILTKLGRQYRIKEAAKRVLGDTVYAKVWSLLNRQETEAAE
jgi:peptidoglycan/xylan/chitin deacetylase (PgdA/CDA1 family)